MNSNIDFWKIALLSPTKAIKDLLAREEKYLIENIAKNSKVLDVGCGEGRALNIISKKTKYLFGIDNDKKAIILAKERLGNVKNVELFESEANKLPFANDFFDVVILFDVFHNLGGIKKEVIVEVRRVLKSGGVILLSVYSEKAFNEKLKLYKAINVKIREIKDTTFYLGDKIISEQFSEKEIKDIILSCGLKLISCESASDIAYLLKFVKI